MNTSAVSPASNSYSVATTLLAGLPLFTLLPLGQDFFLPGVYSIGTYFGNQNVGSLAITVYMICWGIGQVIWGGIVDSIGKKTSAIIGLLLFAAGSYLAAISVPGEDAQFLTGRAIQSLGGAGCFTAIFAIVRSRFEGSQLNRGYSYLYGVMGFVPVASPVVGGLLLQSNQWQFLFEIMTWLGFISVVWVAFSLPNEKRRSSVSIQQNKPSALRAYAVVLKDRVFVTYLTIAVLAQTLFLYYLSYGPAYLIGQLGMDELGFGQQFTIVATAFLLMSFLAPQIIDRFPTRTLLNAALLLMTLASGLMYLLADADAWYAVTVPMIVMTIGLTLVMTSCPGRALESLKEQAGVASGLYSAAQFGMSAAIAGALFTLFDSSDLHVVAIASFGCLVIPWLLFFFSNTLKQHAK
ncbi:Bcr/CflA family protein drug resistance transporter [Vibrio sinaloensis DSM 21326]|uniref:Bcr/CflA family protein drug resistance transporter n=1 Tax=Vibrio sinaloensis DSM 21326 TaxID=945550 RepID=E8MDC6_PHOS4|nr:MFS transporter [Vibrio sinaloensis]EGA67912.1 Bcr/CflA family protein drug resistance transporter [Vibrio sinaloensis DSM 21326]